MNGGVPRWIERLLGIEAAAGEGTVWSFDTQWGWAPWLTLLLVLLGVGWVTWFYRRESAALGGRTRLLLIGLRLGAMGLVLLMLAELMISFQRTGLPHVVVIVDESASMGIADRYEDPRFRVSLDARLAAAGLERPTRINLAKLLLLEDDARLLRQIGSDHKLKVYLLAGAARPLGGELPELRAGLAAVDARGETTRLGAGLRSVLADLRGTPPAAVVLLSDGVTTDGETLLEAAAYARRKGVPLLTVGLGQDQPLRDVELSDLLVDEIVFVDDVVSFQCRLSATGYEGQQVELQLRRRGDKKVLARIEVPLGPDGRPQTVRLPYRPQEVGEFEFEVTVKPLEGEAQSDNNRAARVVSVRKEQIKVLLAQAYPSFEFRYLKNLLERDTTIELQTVLQEADVGYAELDRSALRVFPVRREDLFEYDVLLLGDVNPSFLSASVLANIRDFVVEKGGGVALFAGPRFMPLAFRDTPLADLLPIDVSTAAAPAADAVAAEPFRMQLTELGEAMPHLQLGDTPRESRAIWERLPDLYWQLEAPDVKPAARVLARHPSQTGPEGRPLPLVAMQYVGAGKVIFHATDETWRWRYRVGDVLFARYWVQTIRYLARSKLLGGERRAELSADRRQYRRGEPVRLRVRFLDERQAPAGDDGVHLIVEREGEKSRRLQLERNRSSRGVFEGLLTAAETGNYHVWMASPSSEGTAPSTDFLVVAPPGELARAEMNVAELTRAARQTRGRYYTFERAGRLANELPAGRQIPIESLPPARLWNRWWMLLTFLALLVGEWVLRKRKGLL